MLHRAQYVALATCVQVGKAPCAWGITFAIAHRVQRIDVEAGSVGFGVPQAHQPATQFGLVYQVGAVEDQFHGGDRDGLHRTECHSHAGEFTVDWIPMDSDYVRSADIKAAFRTVKFSDMFDYFEYNVTTNAAWRRSKKK